MNNYLKRREGGMIQRKEKDLKGFVSCLSLNLNFRRR